MYKINCKCPKQECPDNNMQEKMLDNTCANVMSEYDNHFDECACGFYENTQVFPSNVMLGHCYVPRQKMDKVFTPCVGLKMGTMFPELVSPYVPCQSIAENDFLSMREMGGCAYGSY